MLKLHNKKFGRLTAVKQLHRNKKNQWMWLFKCDCGSLITLQGSLVSSGHTLSCGCKKKEWYAGNGDRSRIDITGNKYGYLIAIKRVKSNVAGQSIWLFGCDCGEKKELLMAQVRFGKIKSCGCRLGEKRKPCEERLRRIWYQMLRRTHLNPHKDYGQRGITVTESWWEYPGFRNDLMESYIEHANKFGEGNTSLDRIDVNGNYELNNVRWATAKEQANNRRSSKGVR